LRGKVDVDFSDFADDGAIGFDGAEGGEEDFKEVFSKLIVGKLGHELSSRYFYLVLFIAMFTE
jgi:hypothetical protein